MSAGAHLSKEFFELVKSIGESKSKQEEDRIVIDEVSKLKGKAAKRMSMKEMKEFLIRLVYVEMLGHDASFGYIKAVEDLQSSNILEICAALNAAARLLTDDMIQAVLPLLETLLQHDQPVVRKKTVMLLHRFYRLDPVALGDQTEKFRRALCDRDPSVMGASLHIFYDLTKEDPAPHKDLVSSFVSILKQVAEHRLPRDFTYHHMPAPWIQMRLLQILANLGHADQHASEQMYEVVLDTLRRADTGINVGNAVAYECIRTITALYPNQTLLDAAAAAISRFIQSENQNLRYLGITGLASIVKDHPEYAADHQMAVLDCLEDPDETLKRKTLDLLFHMTNPVNVEVIVEKLLDNLQSAVDVFLRTDLVTRISQVAERYAPSNSWYIQTMTSVFELGGDLVKPATAQGVMRLIAEGSGEDDPDADDEFRRDAVEMMLAQLSKRALPDVLLQTLFWVLGEYGYLAESLSLPEITDKVCSLAGRAGLQSDTRGYALSAAMKLTAQIGRQLPSAAEIIERYSRSRDVDLAQRCREFRALAERPETMREVLPVDASLEDIQVDEHLSFLNGFVEDALAAGARDYRPPENLDDLDGPLAGESKAGSGGGGGGGLRFEAYEDPEKAMGPELRPNAPNADIAPPFASDGGTAAGAGSGGGGLDLTGVRRVWGRPQQPTPQQQQQPQQQPEHHHQHQQQEQEQQQQQQQGSGMLGQSEAPPAETASRSAAPSPTPKQPSEREVQAAALFGGLGGQTAGQRGSRGRGRGAGRSGARNRGPGATRTGRQSPAPAPAPAAAPTPAPSPAPDAGEDLLGLFGDSPSPAPAPAAALAAGHAKDDLFDMFGGGTAPAPAPAPASGGGGGDMFSDMDFVGNGGTGGGGGSVSSASSRVDGSRLGARGAVQSLVAEAPREPAEKNAVWAQSGNLLVSGFKALRPESLVVVLCVANVSGSAVEGVRVDTSPISFLTPTYVGDDAVETSAGGVTIRSIAPGDHASVGVQFVISNAPVSATLTARVTASGSRAPLTCSIPLPVTDLLRPVQATTQDFGAKWTNPAFAHASSIAVASSTVRSVDDFAGRVHDTLHHYCVETIPSTAEAIALAQLMGTPQSSLIHARVQESGVHLTVKTADAGFTAAIAEACQQGLA